jgi:hypothetical protein
MPKVVSNNNRPAVSPRPKLPSENPSNKAQLPDIDEVDGIGPDPEPNLRLNDFV